jgi:hypothetical protein
VKARVVPPGDGLRIGGDGSEGRYRKVESRANNWMQGSWMLSNRVESFCRRGRIFALLLFSVLVLACSRQPQPEELWPSVHSPSKATSKAPSQSNTVEEASRQDAPVAVAEGVVAQLLGQAEANRQQQDWYGVIAVAEQGLRINRRMPQWYVLLAESYLAMQQPKVADAFVMQGQRYCRSTSKECAELLQLQQQVRARLDR